MDLLIHKKNNTYNGEITISGSKNSAVAIIPACLLTNDIVTIHNCPDITDVHILLKIIKEAGHHVSFINNTLTIQRNNNCNHVLINDIDKLRGSYYLIGSYLAFNKKINISNCGGCNLGKRPMDYHENVFKALGVHIDKTNTINSYSRIENIKRKQYIIKLPFPSVGCTINTIIISSLLNAKTIIKNCAREPEIIDLCNFLISLGAKISGIGKKAIIINGVDKLHGSEYSIISDRIECATYMSLVNKHTLEELTINNINNKHIKSYITLMKKLNYEIEINKSSIKVKCPKNEKYINITLITKPYPGFPTDLSPIASSLFLFHKGDYKIIETIFENRFSHVDELKKLNPNISHVKNQIIVNNFNQKNITPGIISAHDLRCAASLLVFAINSGEELKIKNIDYLFRGYEKVIEKLTSLGIKLELLDSDQI